MRVSEEIPGERIVLDASPEDDHGLPGCGSGCLIALLLPAALAIGVPWAVEKPVLWSFVGGWAVLIFIGGVFLSTFRQNAWWGLRFRAERGRVEWTEGNAFGKTRDVAIDVPRIRDMTFHPPRRPDSGGTVRFDFKVEGEKESRAVDLKIDWLATRDEAMELAFRVAAIAGLPRSEDVAEAGEIVVRFHAEGKTPVPALDVPLPAFGKGRFEDASRLPEWSAALARSDGPGKAGLSEDAGRLEIRTRASTLSSFLGYGGAAALLALTAWLFSLSGSLPPAVLLPGAALLSLLAGGVTWLLWMWASSAGASGVVVDLERRELARFKRKRSLTIPLDEVEAVVLLPEKTERVGLALKTSKGALVLTHSSGDARIDLIALAARLSERTRIPCLAYRP